MQTPSRNQPAHPDRRPADLGLPGIGRAPTTAAAYALLDQAPPATGEAAAGSHWSVPWSDLMMVMFVLFAVLATLQWQQQPPPDRVTPPPAQGAATAAPPMQINVFERSRQAVQETRVEDVEIVLLEDQSVKVSVKGPMFFELGRADLRPQMVAFLDRLAAVIRQTPYAVQVIGHTDDHPVATSEFPSNWELSVTRAARVVRHLIDSGGLQPVRFTVMGRGEFAPAVANTSPANRALNRRVDIIITRDSVAAQDQRP